MATSRPETDSLGLLVDSPDSSRALAGPRREGEVDGGAIVVSLVSEVELRIADANAITVLEHRRAHANPR